MKRLYEHVAVEAIGAGWGVSLDGRAVTTPARARLLLPTPALAEALAQEWRGQGDEVRPESKPLTRLAASAIDLVAERREAVIDEIAAFGASDMLCYRADGDDELAGRQAAAWQPLLDWAAEALGARLGVTGGVLPLAQDAAALAALQRQVAGAGDFALAALHALATASGSLVVALALWRGEIDARTAVVLSQLDEDYQIERWGETPEAAAGRRATRLQIEQAAVFLALLQPFPARANDPSWRL